MAEARFRIESLSIEGFKAFGTRQSLSLAGKHCFLFGPNARGKSSVIEAIRWCLFGSERDSEVRNRFHEEIDCRVEVRLRDARGLWSLDRRLRPGSLKSDLTIRDPQGHEVLQKDALPNLVRVGTAVGATVFFSTQQAVRARAYSDISRFHELLYSYLGLAPIDRLRKETTALLEEQDVILKLRAGELEAGEAALREREQEVEVRLQEVLRNPPWGATEPPSRQESIDRIAAYLGELGGLLERTPTPALGPVDALAEGKEWVRQAATAKQAPLDKIRLGLSQEEEVLRKSVVGARHAAEQVATGKAAAAEATMRLQAACAGSTLVELQAELGALGATADDEVKLLLAKQHASAVLTDGGTQCPICDQPSDHAELRARLERSAQDGAATATTRAARVADLQSRVAAATEATSASALASQQVTSAQQTLDSLLATLASRLDATSDQAVAAAQARLAAIAVELADATNAGNEARTFAQGLMSRLKRLEGEWRYHQLREQQQGLQGELTEGLDPARARLRAFEDLVRVAKTVAREVEQCFRSEIDRAIPEIDQMLTETFQRLTDHPAFDLVHIERGAEADDLYLRVGSTKARVPWSKPDDVLNGGAFAALGLVPHFVFSGLHSEEAELNILIIDDPSQSFDTTHVGLLLQELHRASGSAQLILGTHEEERFLPAVERIFEADSYSVVRVRDFRPDTGPVFG